MKHLTSAISFAALVIVLLTPSTVYAQLGVSQCNGITITLPGSLPAGNTPVSVNLSGLASNSQYEVESFSSLNRLGNREIVSVLSDASGNATLTFSGNGVSQAGPRIVYLRNSTGTVCKLAEYEVISQLGNDSCTFNISSTTDKGGLFCADGTSLITVDLSNVTVNGQPYTGAVRIERNLNEVVGSVNVVNGSGTTQVGPFAPNDEFGFRAEVNLQPNLCLSPMIKTFESCANMTAAQLAQASLSSSFDLCTSVTNDSSSASACSSCEGQGGVWTALGCLSYSPSTLIPQIITFAVGMAGGVALLIMLFGAFLVTTGGGSPENVQKGKEMITSAIAGLIFIIFSAVLLQMIGVDILAIPGL